MVELNINGSTRRVDVEPDTPLLWVLREHAGHDRHQVRLRRRAVRRLHRAYQRRGGALLRAAGVECRRQATITTIEGLSRNSSHPVQKAWLAIDVPQCGYCQSGQIMAAAALLAKKPKPTDKDIDEAMTNICRCGTYQRIRAAVHIAAGNGKGGSRRMRAAI